MIIKFIIRLVILVGLFAIVDIYAFQAVKQVAVNQAWIKKLYWAINILVYFVFLVFIVSSFFSLIDFPKVAFYWLGTVALVLFLPKILMALGLLMEDIFRFISWGIDSFFSKNIDIATAKENTAQGLPSRRRFISIAAMSIAAIPFAGMLYGILRGRYAFTVHTQKVPIAGLSSSFEGFKIVQISDIHIGSFGSRAAVKKGIALANAQGADLTVFTGDLVNYNAKEVEGWEEILSELTSPEGVYSILGNHDYGDYSKWESKEAKAAHFEEVIQAHKRLGWKLLRNEHRLIEREGETLALIGVENWGKDFVQHGKLDKAAEGTESHPLKVLLSHDPTHWQEIVKKDRPDIQLTLSGHTHGAQMGIEIPGVVKFSPSQFIYKHWAGLYTHSSNNQHLYVNRGFGHIGFMGRAGIFPEVTVLELVRS